MTNTTNTTTLPRKLMTQLDRMVEAVTAHTTYQELLLATATGWAPSLRRSDGLGATIGAALEGDGRRVFWLD